jgi:ABC-2 type transport system permease protein
METIIPKMWASFLSILSADFKTQWRNRRAVIMLVIVPVIILISWKGLVAKIGGPFILSSCITIGLTAVGLMGYSNAIARDRDRGVFQRLRVAPIPSSFIMISRLTVQFALIVLITAVVFVAGSYFDKITISPAGYAISFFAAMVGGALYLGLGQAIVGLIKNAETVNSTTRLVYFLFIIVGMLGEFGVLGSEIKNIVHWSPYGTVKCILSASMVPSMWNQQASLALLITVVYASLFSVIGIKKFKWNAR